MAWLLRASALATVVGRATAGWSLVMNIHPSDGHKMGWGQVGGEGWPVDGADVGTAATQFSADYVSKSAWEVGADYIAIARHDNGKCEAAEVWQFKDSGVSMWEYFQQETSYQRAEVTGPSLFKVNNLNRLGRDDTIHYTDDPILANEGPLVFNCVHPSSPYKALHPSSGSRYRLSGNSYEASPGWDSASERCAQGGMRTTAAGSPTARAGSRTRV
jgi:hypothetical protein